MKKFRCIYRLWPACLLMLSISCGQEEIDPIYRDRMREFVIGISEYAKSQDPSFIIIPQNGIELVSDGEEEDSIPNAAYMEAIDAHGQEDLFFGFKRDDKATPAGESDYLIHFLNMSKSAGNVILVTDYCSSPEYVNESYEKNASRGYVSFAATHRELDNIPDIPDRPFRENADHVEQISEVQNFLYLLNPQNYSTKDDFIQALAATNYDLLIIDLFVRDNTPLSALDVQQLKIKANGGQRLVVAYMSIGEAENYRYFWDDQWLVDKPSWLEDENPLWEGNYKVQYWDPDWQHIIFGDNDSYLQKILDAGFDGVYLDIIEAFEYFE